MKKKKNYLMKIHGLQRSGTNYLTHLINKNFKNVEVLVNRGGWKHGPYSLKNILGEEELDVIIIVKNPYAWLVSVYEYWKSNNIGPNLKNVSFPQFLQMKAVFEFQSEVPYLFRASNPIQYWNNMYYHWGSIRLKTKQAYVITYESIIEDPKKALTNLAESYGLELISSYDLITKELLPSGESLKTSDKEWTKRDYYLNKGYLRYYTPDLLKFVNDNIDVELMNLFRYNFEEDQDEYRELLSVFSGLSSDGKYQAAFKILDKMKSLKPDDWLSDFNMGSILIKLNRSSEALDYFNKAKLKGCPELGLMAYNEGVAYRHLEDMSKAIKKYKEAIKLGSQIEAAENNIGIAYLAQGKLKEGFKKWEWRFKTNNKYQEIRDHYKVPLWEGQDLGDKKLLVFSEQGRGDAIQFSRYIKMINSSNDIIFAVQKELIKLFTSLGVEVTTRFPLVAYDYAISVNSLPRIFKTTLETIPCEVPYLKPIGGFKFPREIKTKKFKVGFCWAGSPSHPYDFLRSIDCEMFRHLTMENVELFSLQKRDDDYKLDFCYDCSSYINDFNDMAHFVSAMDLIISVDTALVHLAGAMGKPVWALLLKPSCFRWLLGREDTPWYPTMRLFKQERHNEWGEVFDRVQKELYKVVNQAN